MLWDGTHVTLSQQSMGEQQGRGANFGCMACGVRITIFFCSSPPPPHCLFNYHLLQRGRGRGEESERKGNGGREEQGRLGGGAQWCRGWGSRCERVESEYEHRGRKAKTFCVQRREQGTRGEMWCRADKEESKHERCHTKVSGAVLCTRGAWRAPVKTKTKDTSGTSRTPRLGLINIKTCATLFPCKTALYMQGFCYETPPPSLLW